MNKQRICGLLCIVWLPLLILSVLADTEEPVCLDTPEMFCTFARECRTDSRFAGKTVCLTSDIDLTGCDFSGIPVFSGTFDGGGHTVSGISMTSGGTVCGFFRYLTESALVRDLTVCGTVKPGGEKSTVGGIVGENRGRVEGCRFIGDLYGETDVGGIAGINRTTGILQNCTVQGTLYGKKRVGGIAGENAGLILQCTNAASVDTTVQERSTDFSELLEGGTLTSGIADTFDVGGIAGLNTGILQNAVNTGSIGYAHVGYNIGGIAGRQSGYIHACTNSGNVYGRKDVGGIVGQAEPYSFRQYSVSELQKLRGMLDVLYADTEKLAEDLRQSGDALTEDADILLTQTGDSRALVRQMLDLVRGDVTDGTEEVNRAGTVLAEVLTLTDPVTEALEDTADELKEGMRCLKDAADLLDSAKRSAENGREELEDARHYASLAGKELEDAYKELEDAAATLAGVLRSPWEMSAEDLKDAFRTAKDSLAAVSEKLESAHKHIKAAHAPLSDAGEEGSDAADALGASVPRLSNATVHLQKAAKALSDAVDAAEDVISYLQEQPALQFRTFSGDFDGTQDRLSASVDSIAAEFRRVLAGADTRGGELSADASAIGTDLSKIIGLLLDAAEELSAPEKRLRESVQDVSEADTEKITVGKVFSCVNTGNIEADIHVGGIAGSMSTEAELDPEEDLQLPENGWTDSVLHRRAVLRSCRNEGAVTAKKDGCGGIVGDAALGYICDCISSGDIGSTSGGSVGGIAGTASARISSCLSKCVLRGKRDVGGIAGNGRNVDGCFAACRIECEETTCGALLGIVTDGGNVRGNYFAEGKSGGINGVSYVGKAEPLPFAEFAKRSGHEELFDTFTVRFVADGDTVDAREVPYGAFVGTDAFPVLPEREGSYGRWLSDGITVDSALTVFAEYIPYRTVLESGQTRDGTLPVLLVDGRFTDTDALLVFPLSPGDVRPDGIPSSEGWRLSVPSDGADTHTVRYLCPAGEKTVRIYGADGQVIPTASEGKYLTFSVSGGEISFYAVTGSALRRAGLAEVRAHIPAIAAAVLSLLLLLTVFWSVGRRKAKKKKQISKIQKEKEHETGL